MAEPVKDPQPDNFDAEEEEESQDEYEDEAISVSKTYTQGAYPMQEYLTDPISPYPSSTAEFLGEADETESIIREYEKLLGRQSEEVQLQTRHSKSSSTPSSTPSSPIIFSDPKDASKQQETLGEAEEEDEQDTKWDSLATEELQRDGWTLHYDADIEDEESDQKALDVIFSKRDFDYQWDGQADLGREDSTTEFPPAPAPLTSEQRFLNEQMIIPETPARDTLSREACQPTRTEESKTKYYLADPRKISGEKYVSKTEPRMHHCASIESFFKIRRMIDIQIYLYPGQKMISKECRLDATIYQIKMAIGRYVKVPPNHLDFRRNRNLVADDKTLQDLGGKEGHKLKFTVEINRRIPGNYEISMPKDKVVPVKKNLQRKVKVENDDGSVHFVDVTVVYPKEGKPMLGGFIDQRTRKTYHHATTSMEAANKPMRDTQISMGVQSFGNKISGIQTLLDKGQQMERSGIYISDQHDKEMIPRPYIPFALLETRKKKAAVIIQRYWRRWLATQERKRRLDGLIKRVKWAENIRKGRLEQRKKIVDEEIRRQENPKRLVDLELLYRAINGWRKEEEAYVEQNRWCAERKAALATLADIEADLLLDLERTKNRINVKEQQNRTQYAFNKMGKPKRWLSAKTPNFITIDDGEKVHVRQLQAVYTQLLEPVEHSKDGIQSRCELLGELNHLTKDVSTKMSEMLNELVSRELTFLKRPNVSKALLAGVRKRIATTFFFLCQDPDFNKEAKRVQKVPWDPIKLRKDMLQCKGCRRMQYRDEFTIIKGTTVTSRCHTCMNLYRTAILRVDLNLYRHMLNELRRDELAAGIVNSVTFLIDAFDLQFLVEQIWHGQSALSGIDNRYLLRLCRWKKDKPWAPWNCVLLTEEEGTAHLQLENMDSAYKESFFHKVLVKQCTAKTYFEGLAKLAVGLDARIKENCDDLKTKKQRRRNIRDIMLRKAKFLSMLSSKKEI